MTVEGKTCSFFGHRDVVITDDFKLKVQQVVEDLIANKNVSSFLFGSRSNFNYLCHLVVTELKHKYTQLKRIFYTCKSEYCILESKIEKFHNFYSHYYKGECKLLGFEEQFEHKTKWTSGKAGYVERNYAMIDDSDFCVFYYNQEYIPKLKKYSKQSVNFYKSKSGTKIAHEYATQKKKQIINLFQQKSTS